VHVTENEIVTRTSAGIHYMCYCVKVNFFVLLTTVFHICWGSGLWGKKKHTNRAACYWKFKEEREKSI